MDINDQQLTDQEINYLDSMFGDEDDQNTYYQAKKEFSFLEFTTLGSELEHLRNKQFHIKNSSL